MAPRSLKGSVALVTGASRGIGAAVALRLAREGCDVALLARSASSLEELATSCAAHGVRALAVPCDVLEPDSIAGAVERVVAELGGLGILVNNAGIYASGLAHEADMEAFDQVIDVNVKALMRLTHFSLPHLLRAEPAAVINIASVAGKMTFRGGGAYCASKHAVLGFTGSVFEDVREQGVKVCAICPGFVNTSMVADRGLDMDKMIQPDDIAEAVVFVASFADTGCPTEIVVRPQRSPYA